ncbi:MAG: hypothetical protein IKI09_08940 [Bacteroidales bacterium]|nr:hypothetical protein [Bacteroidales bacterium]
MKDKTLKNIKLCCYIALAFCLVWALLEIINLTFGMVGVQASTHPIDWSQHMVVKIIIIACYALGFVSMITLCIIAVFNTLKGLRENTVFPRSNEKLMFWIALANIVYLLGSENFPLLWKENVVFQLHHTNFISPFFLLFFAFMYKVAADAVEENNLTV